MPELLADRGGVARMSSVPITALRKGIDMHEVRKAVFPVGEIGTSVTDQPLAIRTVALDRAKA